MLSLNVRYGKQFFFNRFIIDFAVGLGIKYRDVRHHDKTVELLAPKEANILYASRIETKQYTMNFPVLFKVGYRF
jgi:hypothetical protein